MFTAVQIISILLVALTMSAAVAHAFEFPGKKRLSKEAYFIVQSIYYPGFTVLGGIAEVGGLIFVLVLLFLCPWRSTIFWLTLIAFIGMCAVQAVFWIVTQPVNRYWLQGQKLGRLGKTFFATKNAPGSDVGSEDLDRTWMNLRDRWEYSHMARAGFALVSFLTLVLSLKS